MTPAYPGEAQGLSVDGSNWTVESATMIFVISVGSLMLLGCAFVYGAMWRRSRKARLDMDPLTRSDGRLEITS